ncbi:MAG: N-acetylneuraminate synthase family protein [Methylophilaceae bacterium]|jgi:sialic acid synthase|nr:N-acetylneuraminate synthase family protein [Methylophilaceae bacterium]
MFKRNELKSNSFLIAEVGQNHQGDLDLAIQYIREFASTGADAIKFQTRNNKYLFSDCAYNKSYNSENAFSDVYGQHREKLELDISWLPILKKECQDNGLKFMSTPFDEPSLEVLDEVGVDLYKIASFDVGNLPFINRVAKKGKPVVLSIGGGKIDQIRESVAVLNKHVDEIAILHCVSEYPCTHDRLGLNNIEVLAEEFPNCTIGLSDHFSGIESGPVAYMKGARVFEKHVTINRAWKGTDHSFALTRHGFRNFVRDIRRVPEMMPPKSTIDLGKESVFLKLGKSIVAGCDLKHGDELTLNNLSGKIFGEQFIPVRESNEIIGKTLNKDIKKGELIKRKDLT